MALVLYTSGYRLIDLEIEPRLIQTIRRRSLIVPIAYLFAMFISLLNTRIGLLLYAIIPMLYIRRVRESNIPTSATPQSQEIADIP